MYLIQQTTKQPTEDILGFFYDLATRVAQIGYEKIDGKGIRKDIRDTFPGSDIPFKLLVKGHVRKEWDRTAMTYSNNEVMYGEMEVTFPDKTRSVDQGALMEKIMEKTLLDGESLPNFPKPQSKTPKMYKDLIQEVMKRK